MDGDNSDSDYQDTSFANDAEENKSFVGKVRSRVSGLFNSSLSKWFGNTEPSRPVIRRRDEEEDDDDEEPYCIQPPTKRSRPSDVEVKHNNFNVNNLNDSRHYESTPISNNNYKAVNSFKHFPEPVAGPSGLKSRKTLTSITIQNHFSSNQDVIQEEKDSDSGESTSGYSSMARLGSKEHVSSESVETTKNTSVLNNSSYVGRSLFNSTPGVQRSLFSERSLSPQVNSSLSSRRPSFNASTFGSPNFVDRTISTRKIVDSPFYKGNTIYGGASAYGRRLAKSPVDMRNNLKESIRIKPVNEKRADTNSLSKTAQRILNTLEQYSTPVRDAKRMPVPSRKLRPDGSQYIGTKPYTIRDSSKPITRELQIPTIPDLLKMKERLQESTESVRQIATSSKSILNQPEYEIRTVDEDKHKHTNKIKSKISSIRHKPVNNETVEEVKLTPVALPISTLPKFDLTIPPPLSSKPVSTDTTLQKPPSPKVNIISNVPIPKFPPAQPSHETQETEIKSVQNKPNDSISSSLEYKFSNPLVIAENIKTIIAINNFRFSEPVTKKQNNNSKMVNFNMPENVKTLNLNNYKLKNNGETNNKNASPLYSTGSVMDVLRKKDDSLITKFKPEEGTWECSTCLIRNQPDKTKCAACETPRVSNLQKPSSITKSGNISLSNTNTSGFGDKFKPPPSSWECGVCMVRNVDSATNCVACQTPNNKLAANPPKPTWECPSCMIRNPEHVLKCAACETPKPGTEKSNTKGDSVNKATDWECDTCMVKNKADILKCVCCETPKPGQISLPKETDKIKSFNFGIDAGATSFKFGIPADKRESGKTSLPATVFGEKAQAVSSASTFSFGIKPAEPKSDTSEKGEEKIPDKTPSTNTGFVFGSQQIVNSNKSTEQSEKPSTNGPVTPVPKFNFKPPSSSADFSKPVLFGGTSNAPDTKLFGATGATESKSSMLFPAKNSDETKTTKLDSSSTTETKRAFGDESKETKPIPTNFSSTTNENKRITNMFGSAELKSNTFNSPNDPKPVSNMFKNQLTDNKPSSSNIVSASEQSNKLASNIFGPVPDNKPSNLFGSSNTSKPSSGIFTFGAPAKEPNPVVGAFGTSSNDPKPNTNMFGSKDNVFNPPTASAEFSFGKKEETKPSQPEASNAVFKFGSASPFQAPSGISQFEAPKPSFESPKPITEPTKPMFQSPKSIFESPKPQNNNCFGMPTSINPPTFGTPNSVPLFGSPVVDKPAENKPFKFGGDEPPAKSAMFSFGQTAKIAEPPQTPMFNFTPSSSTPQTTFGTPNSSGFGMAQDKPAFGIAPPNNMFGSSVPSAAKNGGFNFGMASNNNNQKAGFSFGSVPNQPAPQMNATFNFGAPAPAAPTPGGFNFTASPAAFDPNIKPSFNFSAGAPVTTFTAQPSVDSATIQPQRKIKRAIRRTPR